MPEPTVPPSPNRRLRCDRESNSVPRINRQFVYSVSSVCCNQLHLPKKGRSWDESLGFAAFFCSPQSFFFWHPPSRRTNASSITPRFSPPTRRIHTQTLSPFAPEKLLPSEICPRS